MAATGPHNKTSQADNSDSYLTQYSHALITSPAGQFVRSPRGTKVTFMLPNAEIEIPVKINSPRIQNETTSPAPTESSAQSVPPTPTKKKKFCSIL